MPSAQTDPSGLFLLAAGLFFLAPGAVGLLRRGRGWPAVGVLGLLLGGVALLSRPPFLLVLAGWACLLLAAVLLPRRPRAS